MLTTHYASLFLNLALAVSAQVSESPLYDPTNNTIFQLSADAYQAFHLMDTLSLANTGGSNTGELLRIATQIVPGVEESNYNAFYYVAESIHSLAESIDPTIDPIGARENYFHAATYYRGASFFLVGNQSDPRLVSLWNQQITSFKKAIALLKPAPGEPFTLKAKNSSIGPYDIPGYFYKANGSNSTKLPTIMLVSGYDGSQEEIYHSGCVEILLRGINCATYEGPGQPSPRRFQNIGFISDWETATSPVVDYLLTRPDVDPTKIVLLGDSFGGTLAPLAAAHDNRISAVVALDGLADLQQDLKTQFGPELTALFNANQSKEFDEVLISIATNTSLPTGTRWIIQQGLWAFNTQSPFDWFTRLGQIAMSSATVRDIGSRPVYVARGQDDTSLLNQSVVAYNEFVTERPNGKNLTFFHQFPTDLGAGAHCSIGAETQIWTSIFGWLSSIWNGYKFQSSA